MPINDDVFEWMLKRNLKLHNITTARMRNISTFFRDTVLPDIGRQLQITNFAQITNRTAKLAKLRSVITSSIPFDDFQQDAFKFFTEAGNGEAVAFVNWMNQQLPLQVQMNVPAPNLIDAVINEKPFQGELMGDWFGKLKSPIQDGIYRDFRSGFIQGKTIPEMAKLVREGNIGAFAVGGTKKAIRDSKAVVRTGATAVTNRAREVTYTENSDIIKGVRYVATLDDRTTVVCASLHGKIFPISDGPRPPMHWQCRSTTVPEIMSWEEMGLDGKELSGRQMARFNGKPAVGFETDFGKFVDTMTEAQQNKFLGPVRAQMWRDGTVTRIEDFMATTTRMKPLSGFGLNRAGNPIGRPPVPKPARYPLPAYGGAREKYLPLPDEPNYGVKLSADEIEKRIDINDEWKLNSLKGSPDEILNRIPPQHIEGLKEFSVLPKSDRDIYFMADDGKPRVLGSYNYKDEHLKLFKECLDNQTDKLRSEKTFAHEVGHYFSAPTTSARKSVSNELWEKWSNYAYDHSIDVPPSDLSRWVSKYATTDPVEHFAEVYANYITNPEHLLLREPEAFEIMKEIFENTI